MIELYSIRNSTAILLIAGEKQLTIIKMTMNEIADGECPLFGVNVIKPIQVDSAPNERSVRFNWQYDSDPEDTGFSFSFNGAFPGKNLSIAAREYIFRGLGMYKQTNLYVLTS
jgi:hypothetical protein